jgi:large subunit ribosomal protein L10
MCIIDATQKKTVHPPKRTYLHNQYGDIIKKNRAVFIFQHNNLTVKEFTQLRQVLGQLPGGPSTKLTVLRSGVFSSVLRETKFANLEPLVSGPTCALATNVSDAEYPELMKKSVELLSKNKKLLLLGGKLDNVLLNQADVLKVVDLPSIDQLRAQVVGVIEAPVRKLLGTLEQPAGELSSVLDRRID